MTVLRLRPLAGTPGNAAMRCRECTRLAAGPHHSSCRVSPPTGTQWRPPASPRQGARCDFQPTRGCNRVYTRHNDHSLQSRQWTQHCAHSTVGSVQQCCERTSCLSASAILATPSPIPSLMQCCSCGVRANTQACCRRAVGIWACVSSVQLVVPSARTLLERYPFGHTCYCNSHPVEQACVATTLTAAKGGAADDGVGEGDLLRWVGDLLRRTVKHACQNRIACSAAPCVSRPSASAALVTLEIQRRGTERWRGMQTQRIGCGHCDTCVPGSRLLGCPPPPAAACAGRGCCSAHRQCRACS